MKKIFISLIILLAVFSFACRTRDNMNLDPQIGDTVATLHTTAGDIKILLYTEEVPETTRNFLQLADQGKYDNTIFHRVIEDFMIQGGDIEHKDGYGGYSYKGPGTKIKDEFHPDLTHIRGAVSMANSGPDTGGSQFFIVQNDSGVPQLDSKHAVFAYVYEGMDVVDQIASVQTDGNDKPLEDVVLESVDVEAL